jgi:hypothetical protein
MVLNQIDEMQSFQANENRDHQGHCQPNNEFNSASHGLYGRISGSTSSNSEELGLSSARYR